MFLACYISLLLSWCYWFYCIDCLQATIARAGNGEGRLDRRTSILIVLLPTEIDYSSFYS